MTDLKNRMEVALAAAQKAGELTLEYFRQDVEVELKADSSPVTIADRSSEALLIELLSAEFPGDAFLGEESGERPGDSGYRWVLDPIDGTRSFVQGVPLSWSIIWKNGVSSIPTPRSIARDRKKLVTREPMVATPSEPRLIMLGSVAISFSAGRRPSGMLLLFRNSQLISLSAPAGMSSSRTGACRNRLTTRAARLPPDPSRGGQCNDW